MLIALTMPMRVACGGDDEEDGGDSSGTIFSITIDGVKDEYSKWDLETWDALGSWENPKLLIETRRGVFRIVFPSGTSFSDFVPGYSSFEDDAVEISIGGLWNYKENCNYVSGSALVMTNDGEKMKVRFNNYSFSFQEGRMIIFDGTLNFVVNKYFP